MAEILGLGFDDPFYLPPKRPVTPRANGHHFGARKRLEKEEGEEQLADDQSKAQDKEEEQDKRNDNQNDDRSSAPTLPAEPIDSQQKNSFVEEKKSGVRVYPQISARLPSARPKRPKNDFRVFIKSDIPIQDDHLALRPRSAPQPVETTLSAQSSNTEIFSSLGKPLTQSVVKRGYNGAMLVLGLLDEGLVVGESCFNSRFLFREADGLASLTVRSIFECMHEIEAKEKHPELQLYLRAAAFSSHGAAYDLLTVGSDPVNLLNPGDSLKSFNLTSLKIATIEQWREASNDIQLNGEILVSSLEEASMHLLLELEVQRISRSLPVDASSEAISGTFKILHIQSPHPEALDSLLAVLSSTATAVDPLKVAHAGIVDPFWAALVQVVAALCASSDGDDSTVPYSLTSLTSVLRETLGGNCKANLLVNLDSSANHKIFKFLKRFYSTCKGIRNEATASKKYVQYKALVRTYKRQMVLNGTPIDSSSESDEDTENLETMHLESNLKQTDSTKTEDHELLLQVSSSNRLSQKVHPSESLTHVTNSFPSSSSSMDIFTDKAKTRPPVQPVGSMRMSLSDSPPKHDPFSEIAHPHANSRRRMSEDGFGAKKGPKSQESILELAKQMRLAQFTAEQANAELQKQRLENERLRQQASALTRKANSYRQKSRGKRVSRSIDDLLKRKLKNPAVLASGEGANSKGTMFSLYALYGTMGDPLVGVRQSLLSTDDLPLLTGKDICEWFLLYVESVENDKAAIELGNYLLQMGALVRCFEEPEHEDPASLLLLDPSETSFYSFGVDMDVDEDEILSGVGDGESRDPLSSAPYLGPYEVSQVEPFHLRSDEQPHGGQFALLDDYNPTESELAACDHPLLHAIFVGAPLNRIKTFVKQYGANCSDDAGRSALAYATIVNDVTMAELLIKEGANVNSKDVYEQTCLLWAAYHSCEEVMAVLLAHKADISLCDRAGRTALHWSARSDSGCLALLLKHASSELIDKVDKADQLTALHWAIGSNVPENVRALVKARADINIMDSSGLTAVNYAVHFSALDCLKILVTHEKGCVTQRDARGRTALHLACGEGSFGCVEVLVKTRGVDINAACNVLTTPLHWAALFNRGDVIQLLLLNGADCSLKDRAGLTALDHARKKECFDAVRILEKHIGATKPTPKKDQSSRQQTAFKGKSSERKSSVCSIL